MIATQPEIYLEHKTVQPPALCCVIIQLLPYLTTITNKGLVFLQLDFASIPVVTHTASSVTVINDDATLLSNSWVWRASAKIDILWVSADVTTEDSKVLRLCLGPPI